jgi:hypothetical protein
MNHFLECHNKMKADEFRLLSCFEFEEEYPHCCMSKLIQPDFDVEEELAKETKCHIRLFDAAIDRFSKVIDVKELTRFELKVAATINNCFVDELDMTLALPRDLENGENAEGAKNFF